MKPFPEIAPLLNKAVPAGAASLSGVLLALCFAPFEISWLIWVWQWPLLWVLWCGPTSESLCRKSRLKRGFWLGYLAGFVFFTINSLWIFHTGKVVDLWIAGVGAVLGMGLYLGLYVGFFGMFAATAGRLELPVVPRTGDRPAKKSWAGAFQGQDILGPSAAVLKTAFLNGACWCGLEWLRSVAFTGYGWNSLGVALKNHLLLIQFADVIGQIGYGFILMFCGVVGLATVVRFYREIRQQQAMRPHLDFAFAVAMIVALFFYGYPKVMNRPQDTVDLSVLLVQMNVPIKDKYEGTPETLRQIVWDYRDLTRAFVDHGNYDLVMWPETALPTILSMPTTFQFLDEEILSGGDFYLLMGIEENDVQNRIFNTITLMKGTARSFQMYSKIHLVPFGEFIPGRQWPLPIFEWIFGKVIVQDFTRGSSYEPLTMEKDGHRIGIIPLICFEDTVAEHARRFVRSGPQILANVTNDAWFYDSAEPQQHFDSALFRCIELRRPMIRAANTGISGFIDETGSIRDSGGRKRLLYDVKTGSTFLRGTTNEVLKVDLNPPITIFSRVGHLFSKLMGAIALIAFLAWLLAGNNRLAKIWPKLRLTGLNPRSYPVE